VIEAAIRIGNDAKEAIDAELRAITGGAVETTGQIGKLLEWLAANGCELPDLKKPTLKQALQRTELPKAVRRAIKLRVQGAHAATAKYERMRDWTSADGRIRGALTYHGAATGRWTSFGEQLHNLKRPTLPDLGAAIEAVRTGSYAYLCTRFEDPLSVVGDVVRAAICAAPGHKLIAGDFSGVESRVTAWLAGEQTKLEQWAKFDETQNFEDEPYYHLGCKLGFPPDVARASGKVADLAFGFMGGEGAYRKLAPEGDTSTTDDINRQRRAWRDAHPAVVKLWDALSVQAVRAVANPDKVWTVNDKLSFKYDGIFLRMRLPSGRAIAYPFPRLEKDRYAKGVVIFKDNSGGKFVDCRNGGGAWAGIWIENAVQAVARDLFASALLSLETAGYPVVLHVHDEVVAEIPDGVGSEAEFLQILTTPPEWANGLPIAAKVRTGPRFCKTDNSPKVAEEACAEEECEANAAFDEVAWSDQPKSRRAESGSGNRESGQWRDDDYASGEREWGSNVDEYIYRGQTGTPYLKVVRTSNKQFPQFHWEDNKWVKGKPKGPKIPYRLPELLAAPPDAWVHVFEGEKDADNGAALGLVATTHSEGAEGWSNDLVMWFVGRPVIIHEDNDDAGRRHTGIIAFALKAATKEIRVLKYEELPENGDFSDWLDQGHILADLQRRIDAAPPYKCGLEIRRAGKLMPMPPPRQWLLGIIFCRKFLSQLLADGGVGKTALRYAQYISLAIGRSPTGEHVFVHCRVLILSLEDDLDELHRRLWATMMHHKVDPSEVVSK
jgi:AAA domain